MSSCGHNHGSGSCGGSGGVVEDRNKYRFWRSDFRPLATKPLHFDLHFDLHEKRVFVTAQTTFFFDAKADPSGDPNASLKEVKLNSKDLAIHSVSRIHQFTPLNADPSAQNDYHAHVKSFQSSSSVPLKYEVDNKDNFLIVTLDSPISSGQQFVLRTESTATPTAHILEGLYYDYTPPDCPRTIITQCQQHGFQRIVPSVDTMTAKSFYTTTIVADTRYTNIITNGDVASEYFDPKEKKILYQIEDEKERPADVTHPRHRVVYANHKVNMAPYLFFLGCGTYSTYKKELEYPDGDKFQLELLVFPGLHNPEHAKTAIQALADSILWVHISCGPEATEHVEEQKRIYQLIETREELKKNGEEVNRSELNKVREELKKLIGVWKKTGYKYTGQVYREIAMENSDYGGMENVGNTTIVSSRMIPSDLLSDAGYLYMEGVKVHEFYHNINGSEVTGQSPFEIWLNEAVTVHIQRQREYVIFGRDFMRLREVLYSFTPGAGPLAIDASTNSMAIEPLGFNRTQELISAMTYSKAPEFTRMVELLITPKKFNEGLSFYYAKFNYGNATTMDWIESMETASGKPLKKMANGWLKRTGYPTVEYSGEYDSAKKEYTVQIKQTGWEGRGDPWQMPIDWALVKDGKNIHEGVYDFHDGEAKLVIPNVNAKPDFLSFAREWSFFGQSKSVNASAEELALQAMSDTDVINRYFAYRAIADNEKANIISGLLKGSTDYVVSETYLKLFGRLLFDESISPSTRGLILRESDEINSRPDLGHRYWEISKAKNALLQAAFDMYGEKVAQQFNEVEARNRPGPHKNGIHDRALKQFLFSVLTAGLEQPTVLTSRKKSAFKVDVPALAQKLWESTFMSDKLFGLGEYLKTTVSKESKVSMLERARKVLASHPDSLESYIGVLASLDSDDAPSLIRALISDTSLFQFNLAGHARTVARGWSMIRKRSLLTPEGLELTVQLFDQIGSVNQYSAQGFISALGDLPKFEGETLNTLVAAVKKMRDGLDRTKSESLFSQLNTILAKYETK